MSMIYRVGQDQVGPTNFRDPLIQQYPSFNNPLLTLQQFDDVKAYGKKENTSGLMTGLFLGALAGGVVGVIFFSK